jgi:isochorismate synthase EntC
MDGILRLKPSFEEKLSPIARVFLPPPSTYRATLVSCVSSALAASSSSLSSSLSAPSTSSSSSSFKAAQKEKMFTPFFWTPPPGSSLTRDGVTLPGRANTRRHRAIAREQIQALLNLKKLSEQAAKRRAQQITSPSLSTPRLLGALKVMRDRGLAVYVKERKQPAAKALQTAKA